MAEGDLYQEQHVDHEINDGELLEFANSRRLLKILAVECLLAVVLCLSFLGRNAWLMGATLAAGTLLAGAGLWLGRRQSLRADRALLAMTRPQPIPHRWLLQAGLSLLTWATT